MLSTITIFGVTITMYTTLITIGLIIGTLVAVFYFSRFHNIKKIKVFYAMLFGIVGMLIGAKLLYVLINISTFKFILNLFGFKEMMKLLTKGGFVYYGGLAGFLFGLFIYAKIFKVKYKELLEVVVPTIPLMHAIGRLGCFCAGCCYGIEYSGFGSVMMGTSSITGEAVSRFPVQLLESALNLVIFIILCVNHKKWKGSLKTVEWYFILYGIMRFCIEFLRGDEARGSFLCFSTSQWISIFVVAIGIIICIVERHSKGKAKKKKDIEEIENEIESKN